MSIFFKKLLMQKKQLLFKCTSRSHWQNTHWHISLNVFAGNHPWLQFSWGNTFEKYFYVSSTTPTTTVVLQDRCRGICTSIPCRSIQGHFVNLLLFTFEFIHLRILRHTLQDGKLHFNSIRSMTENRCSYSESQKSARPSCPFPNLHTYLTVAHYSISIHISQQHTSQSRCVSRLPTFQSLLASAHWSTSQSPYKSHNDMYGDWEVSHCGDKWVS